MTLSVRLSIVVCTYNRYELLRCCLESLVDQSLSTGLYEVVIVDNNSTDDTQLIAADFAGRYNNFRVVSEEKQGLSHARNCGWRTSSGRFVAFIDDDAKAEPEWCERILHAFETVQPQPTAVGGEIRPWYQCTPPAWFVDDFEIRTWGDEAGFMAKTSGGFSGSNMAFLRDVLEKLNGFSPEFGMVGKSLGMGEEADLFLRLKRDNHLLWYDPRIRVEHWTPKRNMRVSYRLKRLYAAGSARYLRQGDSLSSWYYWRVVCDCVKKVLGLPLRVFLSRRHWKTEMVFCLQELFWNIGFLIKGLRNC
ncbi:glycosyltransferase family 2 protein [Deltaproteobacteria bacterium IMCC39524]|nr:glycosyltransferase family 2 protein [Deltaproteobacteria bacterium IMCC39524]